MSEQNHDLGTQHDSMGNITTKKDRIGLETMPDEIILNILSYLYLADRCSTLEVNRRFRRISQDSTLLHSFDIEDNTEITQSQAQHMMERMREQTHHVVTGNMFLLRHWGRQALKDLLRWNTTVLQSLELTLWPTASHKGFNEILLIRGPTLRKLVIDELDYLPGRRALFLIHRPRDLVEFRLHSTTFTHYDFSGMKNMPQLRTLVVGTKGRDSRMPSFLLLDKKFAAFAPALQSLRVQGCKIIALSESCLSQCRELRSIQLVHCQIDLPLDLPTSLNNFTLIDSCVMFDGRLHWRLSASVPGGIQDLRMKGDTCILLAQQQLLNPKVADRTGCESLLRGFIFAGVAMKILSKE